MLKRSTVAQMRLAVATLATAALAAAASSPLAGCGKEDLPASQGRTPNVLDPNVKTLAGKPDAGPKPPPDPCPGCGMG